MAGSLIKVAETTITSSVSSVSLTGIDSTYDVYMLAFTNTTGDTDGQTLGIRVTKSGTAQSDANYDRAYKSFRAFASFGNASATNETQFYIGNLGTGNSEFSNNNLYLFNFPNASEYSFVTVESAIRDEVDRLFGIAGGFVHTVASASDGVNIFVASGNMTGGTFTLYGLKK
jgi:hypothetical protein